MRHLPWQDRAAVRYQVTSTAQRMIMTCFCVFAFLLEFTSFSDRNGHLLGTRILIWSLLGLLALAAARSAIAFTVILRDDGVVLRELHRTRKIPWTAIDSFVTGSRPFGAMGYRRRVLGVRLADGRTVWTSVNCKPSGTGQQTELDGEAGILNLELRQLREDGGPGHPLAAG